MHLYAHIAMLLLAGLGPLALAVVLPVRWNSLFYFVLAQASVYCFVAPTYVAIDDGLVGDELGGWYLHSQLLCLLFFLPAMLASYIGVKQRVRRVSPRPGLSVSSARLFPFVVVCSVGAVAYFLLLASNDLLFRRIGHSALAAQYLHLSTPVYLFIRVFDRLLMSLVIVNCLAFRFASGESQKRLAGIGFAVTATVQIVVVSINSRFELINTFALIALVNMIWLTTQHRPRRRPPYRVAFAAVLLLSCLVFTVKFRENWQGTMMATIDAMASNVTEPREKLGDAAYKVAARVDGIDLIARMGPALQEDGFSWGESWRPNLMATVGFLWDAQQARDIKADLGTTPKHHLMFEYAGIDSPDYQSCVLTDSYGNFGIGGMVLAGLVIGGLIAFVGHSLKAPHSRLALFVAVVGLQIVSQFEGSLLELLLLDWIRHLPSVALLHMTCPLQTRCRLRPAARPSLARRPKNRLPKRHRVHSGLQPAHPG